jgi:hypothetical protein
MRHMMRWTIHLIGLGLLLPFWAAGDAEAQFNGALRGDYDVTVTRVCYLQAVETSPGSGVFSSNPVGQLLWRGTLNDNGSGTASFVAQSMLVAPHIGASGPSGSGIQTGPGEEFIMGQANLNCPSGTYTVNTDGTFTHHVNCTFTVLTGGTAGSIATWNGVTIEGRLGLDGTVLVLSSSHSTNAIPNVETFEFTTFLVNGAPATPPPLQKRICRGDGVATSRR